MRSVSSQGRSRAKTALPRIFVVSNCTWKDGELAVTFRQFFDLLAETAAHAKGKAAGGVANGFSQIWLPFLDTYRTMCLAPHGEFRQLLERARESFLMVSLGFGIAFWGR